MTLVVDGIPSSGGPRGFGGRVVRGLLFLGFGIGSLVGFVGDIGQRKKEEGAEEPKENGEKEEVAAAA